jgi:hypothetical protein
MKLRLLPAILVASLAVSAHAPLRAQEAPSAPKKVVLAEGAEVTLRMAQNLNSRVAKPGDPIELTLDKDLKVGDVTVAKAGARAIGEVVQAKRPDFWGEAGELSIRVHFLRVGDTKVEIRGAAGAAGTRYVIIRGSQAIIKAGTLVKAFVAADIKVLPVAEPAAASN